MGLMRALAVALLGTLLVATIAAGNVVFAAHQTVLDPGYVSDTVESEGGYEALAEQGVGGLAGGDASSGGDAPIDRSAVMNEAVTEEYVASQTGDNLDRLYAYLHGNSDEPALYLDTQPLPERAANVTEERVRSTEPGELFASAVGQSNGDVPIDADLVRRLDRGPGEFRAAQDEFRQRVRDEVVTRLAREQFDRSSEDELLGLVIEDYDPNDYSEAEKERMVRDRRGEILAALEDRIESERGDEVDEQVDEQLAQIREEATAANATGDFESEAMAAATADLRAAVITALTTDTGYEAYRADATAARDDLAAAAGSTVESRMAEEMPERIDLSGEMPSEQRQTLADAATAVQWLDRLAVGLPALALALVGLLWYVTGSLGRTAGTAGWGLLLVGVPGVAGTEVGWSLLREELGSASGEPPVEIVLGLLDGFLAVLRTQSIALVVVGGLLLAAALADRFGLFESVRS